MFYSLASKRVVAYASIEKFFIEGETGGDDVGEGEDIYIYIRIDSFDVDNFRRDANLAPDGARSRSGPSHNPFSTNRGEGLLSIVLHRMNI